jgi:hypothetical protein
MSHAPRRVMVAEYGTRFEADVAAACLADHGIDCHVRADPAHHVAPHLVTMPGFRLEVLPDDADDARRALDLDRPPDLEAAELDRAYFRVPFKCRPRWIRLLAIAAVVGAAGPLALVSVLLVVLALSRLAPG